MVNIYQVIADTNYSVLQCFSMGILKWHQFPLHFPVEGQHRENHEYPPPDHVYCCLQKITSH